MSHVRHRQANRNLQGWSYTLARVLGIAVFDWADRDSGPRFDALDNVLAWNPEQLHRLSLASLFYYPPHHHE